MDKKMDVRPMTDEELAARVAEKLAAQEGAGVCRPRKELTTDGLMPDGIHLGTEGGIVLIGIVSGGMISVANANPETARRIAFDLINLANEIDHANVGKGTADAGVPEVRT